MALAMVDGPAAGLAVVQSLADDARVDRTHHLDSVRGHLLELAGDHDEARKAYRAAARRAKSLPERRHLLARAAPACADRPHQSAPRLEACPFDPPPPGPVTRAARWVRPELVAEVTFAEWTSGGTLRHPSYIATREDKDPHALVREG